MLRETPPKEKQKLHKNGKIIKAISKVFWGLILIFVLSYGDNGQNLFIKSGPTSIFTRKRKKTPVHSGNSGEWFSINFNGQKSNLLSY